AEQNGDGAGVEVRRGYVHAAVAVEIGGHDVERVPAGPEIDPRPVGAAAEPEQDGEVDVLRVRNDQVGDAVPVHVRHRDGRGARPERDVAPDAEVELGVTQGGEQNADRAGAPDQQRAQPGC